MFQLNRTSWPGGAALPFEGAINAGGSGADPELPDADLGALVADAGPSGDLFVQMSVKSHNIFERDGKNLYCEVPITVTHASLGGELEVPTLDGRVKLKIPAGTQTGKLFRLRGKGVAPVRGGSTGDLLCRVAVETPANLTKHQRELLKELKESFEKEGNQSPKKTSWFEGVKSFFDDMKI